MKNRILSMSVALLLLSACNDNSSVNLTGDWVKNNDQRSTVFSFSEKESNKYKMSRYIPAMKTNRNSLVYVDGGFVYNESPKEKIFKIEGNTLIFMSNGSVFERK